MKRIDNTAVVRAIDPAARAARGRSMVTGFFAAMLVIAGLVPTAYHTTAGFTLQHLKSDRIRLQEEKAKLEAAEAKLVSMDRLQQLAKTLKMSPPTPLQVETLEGKSNTEASNRMPLAAGEMVP